MDSLGACLLGGDAPFSGMAQEIFDERVKGTSWKEIGDKFDLGSPSNARKTFTKLTGITDYKIKGDQLLQLAKGGLDPKLTAPKIKKLKAQVHADLNGHAPVPGKLMVNGEEKVIQMWKDGVQKYTTMAQESGLTLEQVDQIVFRETMKTAKGNVWEAHKLKTTSQEGIKAVRQNVFEMRSNGYTVGQIADHSGIPKDVVQQILNGEWKPSPFMNTLPKHPEYKQPLGSGSRPQTKFGSKDFPLLTDSEMKSIYKDAIEGLSDTQEAAVRSYTGSGYRRVNGALRGTETNGAYPGSTIKRLDGAMVPAPESFTVTRGMGIDGFNMGYIGNGGDEAIREALEGVIFSDPGFLSTSVAPRGVFHQSVRLEIEVPKGSAGIYAQPISSHKSEYEFILARDTKILVQSVERINEGGIERWLVKGRVIV